MLEDRDRVEMFISVRRKLGRLWNDAVARNEAQLVEKLNTALDSFDEAYTAFVDRGRTRMAEINGGK